jgi:K+-sensing histidine kinase KdpD
MTRTLDGRASALDAWVFAVSAAGLVVLVVVAASGGVWTPGNPSGAFWLLVALVVLTELFPLELPKKGGDSESVTVSSTFGFALLLGWGVAASMLALGIASAVADLAQRKPLRKVLFNVAQYSLSLAAAELLYQLLGGGRPFSAGQVPASIAAMFVFFVLNNLLVRITVALASGTPFATGIGEDLAFKAWTSGMLIAMAPVTLIVAEYSAVLIPLLLLPVVAIYLASKWALQAAARRVEAEAAAASATEMATEQARLVEFEQALVRQLKEHDRLKSDLLAAVSHELRTPLTGILGSLVTLSARDGKLTLEQRLELLAMARREGERLKELIEQLLLASRFQGAPSEPAIHLLIDAAEVIRHAGRTGQLDHPGHHLVVTVDGPLPVLAAPEAIGRVVSSLLDNAAKYSPDGTVIRLDAGREAGAVVVAVTDAGPGVPAAERDRIFDRFTQVETGSTRRAGGVGLGLYVARQLTHAQGGELSVGEPAGGSGARFELRLPLATGLGAVAAPAWAGADAPDAGRAANGAPVAGPGAAAADGVTVTGGGVAATDDGTEEASGVQGPVAEPSPDA